MQTRQAEDGAGLGAPAAARLLIHTADAHGADAWTVGAVLQRMRAHAHALDGPRSPQPLLALEVHDLLGRRLLTLSDACRLVDLALPPGTYHVTSDLAGHRRRYTVTLEPGASVDLHLRKGVDRV